MISAAATSWPHESAMRMEPSGGVSYRNRTVTGTTIAVIRMTAR
jgi:hypothetical protein